MLRYTTILIFLFCMHLQVGAQKVSINSGSLQIFKDYPTFSLEFHYGNMSVGRFEKEQDYIDKKIEELNEKEPGRGADWLKKWLSDREQRFEVAFEQAIKRFSKDQLVGSRENLGAKAKMIVTTTFTEPGFYTYVKNNPAVLNLTLELINIETGQSLCQIDMKKVKSVNGIPDTGVRITSAYTMAGRKLGKLVYKEVFK